MCAEACVPDLARYAACSRTHGDVKTREAQRLLSLLELVIGWVGVLSEPPSQKTACRTNFYQLLCAATEFESRSHAECAWKAGRNVCRFGMFLADRSYELSLRASTWVCPRGSCPCRLSFLGSHARGAELFLRNESTLALRRTHLLESRLCLHYSRNPTPTLEKREDKSSCKMDPCSNWIPEDLDRLESFQAIKDLHSSDSRTVGWP